MTNPIARRGLHVVAALATLGSAACTPARPEEFPCAAPAVAGPTRSLSILFWHQGPATVALDLSVHDQAPGRRIRIRPARYVPAVAGGCHATIPVGATELRACASESARCTRVPLPAEGDLWIQLDVSSPDSVILLAGPDRFAPAID